MPVNRLLRLPRKLYDFFDRQDFITGLILVSIPRPIQHQDFKQQAGVYAEIQAE